MNHEPKSLELSLTLAETNLILEALGTLPFVRVFQLIGKIQQQAEAQVSGGPQVEAPGRPIVE
jgi:hypothetical protein